MLSRRLLLGSGAVGMVLATAGRGFSQVSSQASSKDWPQQRVRIILPFAPGGNADFIIRVVADRLTQHFGQPFVVESRPGASGAIAAEAVARAEADGYTLLLGSPSQISITPLLTKTAYDPVTDFAPISVIGTNPKVWAVPAALPVATFPEFVDYVRQRPDQLAYADAGAGSIAHLSTALVLKRTGLRMFRVSYKGNAPSTTDLVAGRVAVSFTNLSAVLPYVSDRSIKLLAVANERRSPLIPTVPTFAEAGFPGIVILTWNGLMAPAGTPRAIIDRIAGEVARAAKDPVIAERLASGGVDPVGNTPDEFTSLIAADISLWKEAIRIAGVVAKN